jgi:hypothetical protein
MDTLVPEQAIAPVAASESSVTLPPGHRLVPALIGQSDNATYAWIPCPAWCTQDHSGERQAAVEDVWHTGPYVDIELPHRDGLQLLAFFRLGLEPYSPDPGKRGLFVFAEDGSDCYFLDKGNVDEFCDKASAQLEKLRTLARGLE